MLCSLGGSPTRRSQVNAKPFHAAPSHEHRRRVWPIIRLVMTVIQLTPAADKRGELLGPLFNVLGSHTIYRSRGGELREYRRSSQSPTDFVPLNTLFACRNSRNQEQFLLGTCFLSLMIRIGLGVFLRPARRALSPKNLSHIHSELPLGSKASAIRSPILRFLASKSI